MVAGCRQGEEGAEFYNSRRFSQHAHPHGPSREVLLENWILILVAFVSGGMLVWPMVSKGGGGGVSAREAVRLINREKGVLIDVCEPAEFAAGHAAARATCRWARWKAPRICRRTRPCRCS
jgi:hypothetical protein